MTKRIIIVAIFSCFIILLSSLPASSAVDQWSYCTIDRVGVSSVSGNAYVRLTWVSGGDSWTGTRLFYINPTHINVSLATLLTAFSTGSQVHVQLADSDAGSLLKVIYILNE